MFNLRGQEYMYQHSDMDWDYMDLKALLEHTRHRYTSVTTQRAQLITIICSLLCCVAVHCLLLCQFTTSWSHHFESFTVVSMRLDWPLWKICVTNDHSYVPIVVSTSQSCLHSWLTLPDHTSSLPVYSGIVLLDL